MTVYDITSVQMFNELLDACDSASKFLVVKASATWCGPCKMIVGKYHALAEKYDGKAVFCTFDVDSQQELAEYFTIKAMPTLMVIKNKNIIKRSEGANLGAIEFVLEDDESF